MSKVLLARFSILAMCVAGAAGCTVSSVEQPGLTGPSDLSMDVQVTATPDSLVLDGLASSLVGITVRGPNGGPLPNQQFRLSIVLAGQETTALGTISPTTVFTDANGRATAQFQPKKAAPGLAGHEAVRVSVVATRVSSNYQTITPFAIPSADVLLLYPPVPVAPLGSPAASLTYGGTPKVGTVLTFDASASQPAIGSQLVKYDWDFGDGLPHDEHGSDASHAFVAAGTYNVTLGVTDDSGRTGNAYKTITVTN